MKKLGSLKVKRLVALLLSLACSLCLLFAVGCSGLGEGDESNAKKSIFYARSDVYTLTEDYSLSEYDETARRGSEGEVKFSYAFTLDLGGKTLDLAGRSMVVATSKNGALVSFKNGAIKGGKINVSVPNGDVSFDGVTIDKDVTYELEAASQTIRMNNSTLLGSCVIVSNTHVEINRSEVGDVTMEGSGTLNLGTDATLNNLEIGKDAAGAKVIVSETAQVTGDLTVGAPSDVVIGGSVSKVSVKENLQTSDGEGLNVKVEAGASVQKLEINSQASVEVAGTVSHVEVSDEEADVTVSEDAIVGKVDLKAPAEVTIQGTVSDVVVQEDAAGATVSVKGSASVSNVVVGANDTKITVEETSTVTTVKVVEEVTGTDVPDSVTSETIAKEDAEEYFKHVHNYRLVSKIEPTCEEAGKEVYKCVDGDDETEKIIKALGHDYEYEIVKMPTATEVGEGKYTCTRCGHSYTKELPVTSSEIVTVNGLPALLQAAFGDGLDLDFGETIQVMKTVDTRYDRNGEVASQEISYTIVYVKQASVKLDFSDEKAIKGIVNILSYVLEVDDIDGVDFKGIAQDKDALTQQVHLYIENENVYVISSDDTTDTNVLVNLGEALKYLATDQSVPAPVKAIAQGVKAFLEAGELEIDVGGIKAQISEIVEALGKINLPTPDGEILSTVLKSIFTETEADGEKTYTLSWEKIKGLVNKYAVMSVSDLADEIFGENSVESLASVLKAAPDFTIGQAVTYLETQLKSYDVEIEDVYAVVELIVEKVYGQEIDVAQMVEYLGDVTVAGVYAMAKNMTEAAAKAEIISIAETLPAVCDALTIDDVVTQIVGLIVSSQGGEIPEDFSVAAYINVAVDQLKDIVAIKVTEKTSVLTVKVTVIDQDVTLSFDVSEGLTIKGVYEIAEAVAAEIKASIANGKFSLSANVLGYIAGIEADKTAGTFTAEVKAVMQGEDEEGNATQVEQIMVSVVAGVKDGKLTATVNVLGQTLVDLSAAFNEGSVDVVIPVGEAVIPANLSWKNENGVTVAYLTVPSGETATVVRLKLDLSSETSVSSDLSIGGFDEENNYVEGLKLVDFTASLVKNDDEEVEGFKVDYETNVGQLDLTFSGSSDGISYSSETSLYLIKGSVVVKTNQEIEIDDDVSNKVLKDLDVLKKVKLTYDDYGDDVIELTYTEEGSEQYYVYKRIESYVSFDSEFVNSAIGRITTVTSTMRIDSVNGLPSVLSLTCNKECQDWYHVSMQISGECTVSKVSYAGTFKKVDGEWVPEEDCIEERYTETDSLNDSVYCYYNSVTKKATREEPHKYEVASVEYLGDSHKCEGGLLVKEKCAYCGKITTIEAHGCYYKLDESITFKTDCGTTTLEKRSCVGCGKTYCSAYGNASHSYVGTWLNLTEAEINALKAKYNGYYYSYADEEMCVGCNLVVTSYYVYTCVDGVCSRYEITKYETIDHDTEQRTLQGEFEVLTKDVHHTEETSRNWRSENGSTDDEQAVSWIKTYNAVLKTNYSLNDISSMRYSKSTCQGCKAIVMEHYDIDFKDGFSSFLRIGYENGTIDDYYYSFNDSVENIEDNLSQFDFSSFDVDLSVYTGKGSIRGEVNYSSDDEGCYRSYGFYFNNGDTLYYTVESYYIAITLFDYDNCQTFYQSFYLSPGGWYESSNYCEETHTYRYKSFGENCVEDGCGRICVSCGATDEVYHAHDEKGDYIYEYSRGDMNIEYKKHRCCDSFSSIKITLTTDCVLTEDFCFKADEIVLDLNGYTLDLNGHDLILYAYLVDYGKGSVSIVDTGRTLEDGTSVNGKIINSQTPEEGVRGLLVLCANQGDVDVANLNADEGLKLFASDTVNIKGLYEAVKNSDFAYELELLKPQSDSLND